MNRYGVKEVCRIIGIKPHILRYWEEQVSLLTPLRSDSGHRRWTSDQVRTLRRLQHLIVERGMSVHAAEEQIIRESTGPAADRKSRIAVFRDSLESIRDGFPAAGNTAAELPPAGRGISNGCVPTWDPVTAGILPPLPAASAAESASPPALRTSLQYPSAGMYRTALVTAQNLDYRRAPGAPPEILETSRARSILSVTAKRIAAEPEMIPWIIVVRRSDYPNVLSYLDKSGWFGLSPGSVQVVAVRRSFHGVGADGAGVEYRLSSDVSAILEVLTQEQLRLWLGARRVRNLYLHRVLDLHGPVIDPALVAGAHAELSGYLSGSHRTSLYPAAISLPRFTANEPSVLASGTWRRILNTASLRAETIDRIWKYQLDPNTVLRRAVVRETAAPVPFPWSPTWPREMELLFAVFDTEQPDSSSP